MSDAAAIALVTVRTVNTLLQLARELQVSYQELADIMERAEQEGREVTLDDLESLRTNSDQALERLRKAINAARQ